ncbi:MAG: hypothetical protein ACE5JN_12695 [Candidatus Methylomirabilia bacterium]
MLKASNPFQKRLEKKARRGFRGYPVGTIAYYGADNKLATKVAVGIVLAADGEPAFMERWFSENRDVRRDSEISRRIVELLEQHGALSVIMTSGIIGCPHEEGIDYPEGAACPECPFWADKDRWEEV